MSMSSTIKPGAAHPFASLADLRVAHIDLLKQFREQGPTDKAIAQVVGFLHSGRATGALLSDTEERWSAQSILDYWATTLYQHGQAPIDATLAEFDPYQAPILADESCPYLGLDTFLERDHDRFFGRGQMIHDLLAILKERRLLMIVGPSGSGKSSLTLAGLLAELRRGALPGSEQWRYYPRIVPGSNPLNSLARVFQPARQPGATPVLPETWLQRQVPLFRTDLRHLARLALEQKGPPVTLIVDQFEEVFTLCDDVVERQQFISNLLGLTLVRGSEHRVIFTLRSDFESYLLQFPKLEPHFRAATVRLMPLNASELREAIERPADQVGLKFDSGLVDALIQDILGEPAALPLLQFTLFKLWQHRERNRVTWASYRRLGGGRVALANSADELYRQLIPEEQQTLRRILLRMVRPGEGLEVTSSRVRRELFYQGGEDPGRVDRVLGRLIGERLIRVTDGATPADTQVEVAHEALVRNWPLLVEWVAQAREELRQRYRLTRDAEDWNAHGRDPSLLLGETRLREATRFADLSRLERDFIAAGRDAVLRQQQAEEQARAEREALLLRELSQQTELAIERERYANERAKYAEQQIRANRRLRTLSVILAIMTGLAVMLALFVGYLAWANTQQAKANMQQAQLLAMINAARNAPNPDYGLVWAEEIVQASQIDRQVASSRQREIAEMLHEVFQEHNRVVEISPVANRPAPTIQTMAWSPDGTRILTANADGIARIFNAEDWSLPPVQIVHTQLIAGSAVTGAAWSFDGQRVVTTGEDHFARVWQAVDGKLIVEFEHSQRVNCAAWSYDNRFVVTTSGNLAQIWDVESKQISRTFAGHTGDINSVSWSPDNRYVLTASADGTLRIWDVGNGSFQELDVSRGRSRSSVDSVTSAAWSPDGQFILAGKADGSAQIWGAAEPEILVTLDGHGDSISALAWSPDNKYLVTGSIDNTVRVWEIPPAIRSGKASEMPLILAEIMVLRGSGSRISAVSWSPDRKHPAILTASGNQIHLYRFAEGDFLDARIVEADIQQEVNTLPATLKVRALDLLAEAIDPVAPKPMIEDIIQQSARLEATVSTSAVAIGTSEVLPIRPTILATQIASSSIEPLPTTALPIETSGAPIASPTIEQPTAELPTIAPILPTPVVPLFATPTSISAASHDPVAANLQAQLDQRFNDAGGAFGVLAIDITSGETIYDRDSGRSFFAASLIKLPIAMTVYHMAANGELSLSEQLTLMDSDKVGGTGDLQGEPTGSSHTLRELVQRMLRDSDNTASNMVLSRIGFERVNRYMRELGATETIVQRLFFDEAAIEAGKDIRTSPHDMALLLDRLFFNPNADTEFAGVKDLQDPLYSNRDSYKKIREWLPADTPIWNKTGVLSRMEHDAAVIKMPDGHWLIVVMMSDDLANQRAIDTIVQAACDIYAYESGSRSCYR